MTKVGLHGKSFIPMLSSSVARFHGIMATRTIKKAQGPPRHHPRRAADELLGRLPVLRCSSARASPSACFGFFKLAGLTMLGMYLLGIVVALSDGVDLRKRLLKGRNADAHTSWSCRLTSACRQSHAAAYVGSFQAQFITRAGTVIRPSIHRLVPGHEYPSDKQGDAEFGLKTRRDRELVQLVSLNTGTGGASINSPHCRNNWTP